MGHLEHVFVGLVDRYGYFGLFVALLLGNIGAPVGSEVVLPVSGGLTATGHLGKLWMTIAVAIIGELAGGSLGYAIGRFGGVPFVEKFGKYVHFTHDRLMKVHGFFERWGTFAIFICRFLPVIRGIVAIPAGIAEMNLGAFYLWTFAGSGIFCTALILLGYSLGDHLDAVLPLVRKGGLILLALAALAVAIVVLVLRARSKRARAVG
jgi:membrane protein DedA with SNARE-associated domain